MQLAQLLFNKPKRTIPYHMDTKPLLLLSCALIGFSACQHETKVIEKKPVCISDSLAKTITIDTAKLVYIKNGLSLSGEVASDDNKVIKIFPSVSGRVVSVKVSLGDRVTQGQVLAIIKSADVTANYSDLASAKSDMAIAKRQMDAAESLYKNGIASERDYTEAKESYNKAVSANRKIEQLIQINGNENTDENGNYIIKAPISGYIIQRKINEGNFIRPDNSDNLFVVSDLKDVWIWANVFETDISKVKIGYDAQVTTLAYPNEVFKGKIDQISAVLDPDNKVMKVRISLPNPDLKLKPEMFTNVQITHNDDSQAVTIPTSAIVFNNSKNFVVIYEDTCRLKVQEIQINKSIDGQSYIISGLKPGDRVISKNQLFLYNSLIEE